jgi:hypothetical protein
MRSDQAVLVSSRGKRSDSRKSVHRRRVPTSLYKEAACAWRMFHSLNSWQPVDSIRWCFHQQRCGSGVSSEALQFSPVLKRIVTSVASAYQPTFRPKHLASFTVIFRPIRRWHLTNNSSSVQQSVLIDVSNCCGSKLCTTWFLTIQLYFFIFLILVVSERFRFFLLIYAKSQREIFFFSVPCCCIYLTLMIVYVLEFVILLRTQQIQHLSLVGY